jgi:membrane-bound lytic murein transglycosylase F
MRAFTRISAVLVLLVAPTFSMLRASIERKPRRPNPSTVRELGGRGDLRFGVPAGSLAYFRHGEEPCGFEYRLLSGFARSMGAALTPRVAPSWREAERWLRDGVVDVAITGPEPTVGPGLLAVPPYVVGGDGRVFDPPTGRLVVRAESADLRARLYAYLRHQLATAEGRGLLRRFFGPHFSEPAAAVDGSERRHRASVESYRGILVRHAASSGYDWRLLAAVIAHESGFDPTAVSPKGAVGLMQVMPATAEFLGFSRLEDPEANLRAGVGYLRSLSGLFPESSGEDRIAMVLTAYLIGPGHVRDAQALAREVGLDPNVWWGGLEEVLPLLEDPHFHERLRYGYARGSHAVDYVYRVFRLHRSFAGLTAAPQEPLG